MAVASGFFKLRADQYRDDPLKWFVKPPIDIAALDYGDHSIRLVGSRGCGKTMLLRSIAEQNIGQSLTGTSKDSKTRIRAYIRPDNQLMNSLNGWDIKQEQWASVALELMFLRILREIANKINNWIDDKDYSQSLCLDEDKFCFSTQGVCLHEWIRRRLHSLYQWIRNPDKDRLPELMIASLDGLSMLVSTVSDLFSEFPKNYSVSVYIDELEIYPQYQQRLINDWIKNPPLGWVFHVAHRRYLVPTTSTSSFEHIEPSNDFRVIDLDAPLSDESNSGKRTRKRFYLEIINKEIEIYGPDINFDPHVFLPVISRLAVCEGLRDNKRANEAWRRLVRRNAQQNGIKPEHMDKLTSLGSQIEDPRWWVLWPTLIAADQTSIIDNLKAQKAKDWLNNKLFGSILQIYIEANDRLTPLIYSGFEQICSIVLSNVREFMLIIRQAIENELITRDSTDETEIITSGISYENQSKAILNRSENFSKFVSISASKFGFNIQQALDNWYVCMRNIQMLPTLPYNEPNHIVCSSNINKSDDGWKTIEAGESHGAFLIESATKLKTNERTTGQKTLRIHPLLCVSKCLSYRKRNSPSLNWQEINSVTTAEKTDIVKSFVIKKFSSGQSNLNHELDFS